MPSIDDILDALKDEDGSEEEPVETSAPKENKAFKELRDHAKRLERENARLNKEMGELRDFKSSVTKAEKAKQVQGAFKELGLNEKQAELFLRVTDTDEITTDGVREFAQQYGLIVGEEDGDISTTTVGGGFPPSNVTGSADPGTRVVTRDDFEKIAKTNPTKARELLSEGRVKWNNLRTTP